MYSTVLTRDALVALEQFRAGCTTTKKLASRMGIKVSSAGHLRGQLEHFGAIHRTSTLRDGSKVFEPVPGWVAPERPETTYQSTVALDLAWPIRLSLPSGVARFVEMGG